MPIARCTSSLTSMLLKASLQCQRAAGPIGVGIVSNDGAGRHGETHSLATSRSIRFIDPGTLNCQSPP